ncbi:MAG TPA: hypothetical protein VNF99_09020 [Stellaceae bacterium]|nr:hypothetical protein [Stellaceae bacterium]
MGVSLQLKVAVTALVGGLALCGVAQAGQLKEIARVPVKLEAPMSGFDIGTVDTKTNRYLLTSHWSRDPKDTRNPGNNAVLVFDANTNKLLKTIPGVRGSGIVSVGNGNEAWVGTRKNGVDIVDVVAGKALGIVDLGGGGDELTYDPKDGVVAVALPDNDPPTLVLISVKTRKVVAKVAVPEATDGLEQTIYSPVDGMFWTDVPELNHDKTKGGMMEVDPKTGKRVAIDPVDNCKPHGNAIGVGGELYLGCNLQGQQAIFNVKTGKVDAYVPGAGGSDETAADDVMGQYYSAAAGNKDPGPVLAVVDAKTRTIIQKIPTAGTAHSVAVDPKNHHVFLPEGDNDGGCSCVRVFAAAK